MYAYGAIALASIAVGYFVGSGLTERDYLQRLHDQAVAYAEGWQSAVETANRESEAQRRQDVAQAEARGKRSAAAREVIRETHLAPSDCVWTPDDRLRIERLYAAHGYSPAGSPAGVSD